MTSTIKDFLESGVHFGHQKRKWNPKMRKYIFGSRNNIYIIDLQQTVRYLRKVYNVVRDNTAEGQNILFVGTKKQAVDAIGEYAKKCDMPYVNYRWLGGILTNFNTIRKSIKKMETIEKMEEEGKLGFLTKKEALILRRKKDKLKQYFDGIRGMTTLPDMIFVIDTVKEHIVVKEAKTLGIPIIAPLDTNCDPDDVTYKIPSNDDAIRSIRLICSEITNAILEGKEIRNEKANEEEALEASDANSEEAEKEVIQEVKAEAAAEVTDEAKTTEEK